MKTLEELQWEYSRNQRRHTAFNAAGDEVFWIISCAPFAQFQRKHGYRLQYPNGSHIQHSKSVKLLKAVAEITPETAPSPSS